MCWLHILDSFGLIILTKGFERENEVEKVTFSAAATEKVNRDFQIPMVKEERN